MNRKQDHTNLIIIEDELPNSRMLMGLVENLRPNWTIGAVLESVEESVTWLSANKSPDLILMDIQLSDGICFSIFDKVRIDKTTRIIFTTAYDEYAIRAFKVNSIDYLLKPVEEEELENAFQKFEQFYHLQTTDAKEINAAEHYKKLVDTILNEKKEYRSRFLIAGLKGYSKLDVKNIAFFYSENKLTFAVDFEGNEHLLDYNLEQIEDELDPTQFFRSCRKAIVNINAINKIDNELGGKLKVHIEPEPYFDIIVSRLKASAFKKWMGK